MTHLKFKKWHSTFWENLETSIKLHKIEKLIVINHRDCGAAKIVNRKKIFNKSNETKIHINSFTQIKKRFKKRYPKLTIELKLFSLNGKVENY